MTQIPKKCNSFLKFQLLQAILFSNIPNSKEEYLISINVTKEVYSKINMEYSNELKKGSF